MVDCFSFCLWGICLIRVKVLQDKQYFLVLDDGKRVPLGEKQGWGSNHILEVSEEVQVRPMLPGTTWSILVWDGMLDS